jgi:hypothetical protein
MNYFENINLVLNTADKSNKLNILKPILADFFMKQKLPVINVKFILNTGE